MKKNKQINRNSNYILLLMCMLFSGFVFGQKSSYTISGKITDAQDGSPIIGASVIIQNTNSGAQTDFNGDYSINAQLENAEYSLLVSYLGYVTKKIKFTPSESNITLNIAINEDLLSLDEVIITGTTIGVNKRKLGNAISSVKATDLVNNGAIAADQAISGKVTGALVQQNSGDPAGGISIRLRGASTVLGNSDPLYIVDGIIVSNNSSQLIDVGGAAQNRMADINPNDIERIEVIKGAAAAAIYGSRASNGVVQIFTKSGKNGKPRFSFSSSIRINSLRKKIDYNTTPLVWEDPSDVTNLNTVAATRYDMQDLIFDTAYGTENHFSVNGGTENTSYYMSLSHLDNGGIIKNTDFKRSGFKVNLKQKAWDWLDLNVSLNYTRSNSSDRPNGGINEFYGALTGFIFGDNANNPYPEFGVYPKTGLFANPLEVVDRFDFGQTVNRVITSVGFDAKITEKLSANYKLGIDFYNHSGKIYIPVGNTSYYSEGFARRSDLNNFQYNSDLNFVYQTDINDDITSTTTLGGSWQYENAQSIGISSRDLPPVVQTASTGNTMTQGEYRSEISFWGGFIQQSFDYKNKLYLNGALRMDGASSFGKNERNQLYAKASASYIVSEEGFWSDTFGDTFNTLKLRASWGQAGNLTALGAYQRYTVYNTINFNGTNGLVPSSTKGYEDIAPERQSELEVGFDASFLQNRVGIEFTYYNQKVTDLLLTREFAPSKGYTAGLENIGNLTNKGIEVLLKGSIIKSDDLSWDASLSYSKNKNEVTKVSSGGQFSLPGSFGVSSVIQGQPIGVFYGFYYNRNTDGTIALDANGYPSKAEDSNGNTLKKILGDPNPDWFGSLINNVSYKNLSLRVQLDAVQGYDVFNWNSRILNRSRFGGGVRVGEELAGTRPKGYGNKEYGIYEAFVEDGSFVKLREIALSYSFTKPFKFVDNIQLNLIGRNLVSWDNYSGWDPEITTSGQSNGVRGFDIAGVPIPKTFQFGVNVKF